MSLDTADVVTSVVKFLDPVTLFIVRRINTTWHDAFLQHLHTISEIVFHEKISRGSYFSKLCTALQIRSCKLQDTIPKNIRQVVLDFDYRPQNALRYLLLPCTNSMNLSIEATFTVKVNCNGWSFNIVERGWEEKNPHTIYHYNPRWFDSRGSSTTVHNNYLRHWHSEATTTHIYKRGEKYRTTITIAPANRQSAPFDFLVQVEELKKGGRNYQEHKFNGRSGTLMDDWKFFTIDNSIDIERFRFSYPIH